MKYLLPGEHDQLKPEHTEGKQGRGEGGNNTPPPPTANARLGHNPSREPNGRVSGEEGNAGVGP